MRNVLDLFAGIGGFSLGLERAGGFTTKAFCEIDQYCQQILRRHWPEVPIYDDVRKLGAINLARDGIDVDVVTAGFPCSDISKAGKMAGIHAAHSGLWKEAARIIGEIRPQVAVVENVAALLAGGSGQWLGRILGDMAALGYDAEWHCVPAAAIGAHHYRDRLYIVAHANGNRCDQGHAGNHRQEKATNCPPGLFFDRRRLLMEYRRNTAGIWAIEPRMDRVAHGIPGRVDRVRALGNSVTPPMAEYIGKELNRARYGAQP